MISVLMKTRTSAFPAAKTRVSDGPGSDSSRWSAPHPKLSTSPLAATRLAEAAWYLAALLIILASGLTNLAVPLHGDEALFLLYARGIEDGARLYIDLWDVKPPAIYAFYYLGGKVFGFTDYGIHLFELCWMLVLAASMMLGLRPFLRHGWLAAVAPVAALGTYYALTSPGEKTQVESLVSLPIFLAVLALAAAVRSSNVRPRYALLAGIAAATATVFKVIFALIFIAMMVVATITLLRTHGMRAMGRVVMRLWLPFTAGVTLVWAAVTAVFVVSGTADVMLWTIFGFPLAALGSIDQAPFKQLIINARLFFGHFAPWLIFVAVCLPLLWRRNSSLFFRLLWTWLIVGTLVVLLQKTSWWYYHCMLLIVPIGCFAAIGIDRIVSFLRVRGKLSTMMAMTVSCLLVVPAVGSFADPIGAKANLLFPPLVLHTKSIDSFKATFKDYPEVSAAASFVRDQPAQGPVMVFETPLINLLSGRKQATPIPGFIWGWILPRHYQQTTQQLIASPPPFVFVGHYYEERVRRLAPGVIDLLDRSYRVVWSSPFGRWYALQKPRTADGRVRATLSEHE